ncbi:hypothetical protein HC256_000340 [Beauveria bassiana]|nr:hypothetical protein HC256_000340 [Beauveria bassiana]
MAALPQATPLLLTKRLNAFLRAHTSPSLPTLLLTTHHGKLLAHASSLHQPVAVLRTHATVAASLLAIHTTTSSSTVPPLPTGASPSSSSTSSVVDDDDDEDDDDETAHGSDDDNDGQRPLPASAAAAAAATTATAPIRPVTITVQLSGGTVIIRRLKCGLLLVCVGPSSSQDATSSSSSPTPAAAATPTSTNASVAAVTQALESADLLSATPTTATAKAGETESLTNPGEQQTTATTTTATTANNEGGVAVGAAASAAASTSVVALRRRAAELARWLDEKLGALTVPEDSTGAD